MAGRRWRAWSPLLLLASGWLTGCFTADATLDPDGAGTIELTYPLAPNAQVEKEKERFGSPHVTVVSYVPKADHTATVTVKFDGWSRPTATARWQATG